MTEPPILLVRSGGDAAVPDWQAAFRKLAPDLEVRGWNDPGVDPARVHFVLVWEPEPGRLTQLPNLQLIFSSAAGVDHITRDISRPSHVPIIRMGASEMAQTVGEYVCLAALSILRDLPRMLRAHAAGRWDAFEADRTAPATHVGIMGMGAIGQVAAGMLRGIGFPVHGWSRTRRSATGYAGLEELPAFLAATDLLVAILPDTPETAGLLNADRLAMLRPGAGLINVGRGSLLALPDLLDALDRRQVGMAILDVFETEPLPSDSPAWRHERLIVTAHVAGFASRPARAAWVVACIDDHESGRQLRNVYDPARGY